MAPKIYCFQSKHYENTMQFICNTINPVHCKMCHLINLLKSTEPQFISKFISSHQSVLWLLPEVWDLHAFSFFFISAEKTIQLGDLKLCIQLGHSGATEIPVRVTRAFELSHGGPRTTSGLWHNFMNEHQDAGCTVISPGGKMRSSNNSATV